MSLLDSNNEPSEVQLKKLMKNVLIDVKKRAKIAKMNLKKIQENDLKIAKSLHA
jgi:hypothetical protein